MSDRQPRPVVVDTFNSPHARLRPIPLTSVTLTDTFWAPRMRVNREQTLPEQYHHLEETHRVDNFRRAAGKQPGTFEGIYFNDSDVYKWLEAASWALASGGEDAGGRLAGMVDAAIQAVADAQQPDGYLNSYYTLVEPENRWSNLRDKHELYCAGHLIQAAVAHHRATGRRSLLDVSCRFADLICEVFGPEEEGKRPGTGGHEEIEMAMVELARDTGEARYLRQARFFVDVRGQGTAGGSDYHQDHKPVRDMDPMVGHAVRAVYLNAGVADVCLEEPAPELWAALERMWATMTRRQIYLSGAIGSRYQGEAFGADFELPNDRAYAETCAAIGSMMWNWRMLARTGEARFADLIETTLYNAVLPGLSLDGEHYFYQNPLENDGTHCRQPWFGCACCPPNIARLLASLPGYLYTTSDEGVWVHLYAQGSADVPLAGGSTARLEVETAYPWEGSVRIEVQGAGRWTLFLRIPAWAEGGASLQVNGVPWTGRAAPGSYAALEREWALGDVVELDLPMPVRRVESHPYVPGNAGRVALMRGPLLYCFEAVDHPGVDQRDVVLPVEEVVKAAFRPDLLQGVVALSMEGQLVPPDAGWTGRLYRTAEPHPARASQRVGLLAVPYYAWANREPGRMMVWVRSKLQT